MPLVETIAMIWGTAVGSASGAKDIADFLRDRLHLETRVAHLVAKAFDEHLPRLRHLCIGDVKPTFNEAQFRELLRIRDIGINRPQDLVAELLPILTTCVHAPAAMYEETDFQPVYSSILASATRGMWKEIGRAPAEQVLLTHTATLIQTQSTLAADLVAVKEQIESLDTSVKSLAEYSRDVWRRQYDRLLDSAPPAVHEIDSKRYVNPFLLARAEDFNHNYGKLAELFQYSPEWDTIQRRTENVFIEGGRGTGKSMLLRRLTAQATIAAHRLTEPSATLETIDTDYFGVYIKLTRGYYEQLQAEHTITPQRASLLAQHELNIEIFDAFVDTLEWLQTNHALPILVDSEPTIAEHLASLFETAPRAKALRDLHSTVIYEQNEILGYFRSLTFDHQQQYRGSAKDTVTFVRGLSDVFRARLFPKRELRLFILVDEFESLLQEQQVALNTVMKMRLPDVSFKIGVRVDGRKTQRTFTPGDPIQKPRDYTLVRLDYDIQSPHYRTLLEGIASKRLQHARYPESSIGQFLQARALGDEVKPSELASELKTIWNSGNRRSVTDEPDEEFRRKYSVTAVYRILARKNSRKSFAGFDHYLTLSSGVVSNFIELCKYTFYLALSDSLPLHDSPAIPTYLQTDAVYLVSERLLEAIEGNVEVVGPALAQLISDLGSILRSRLLNHPSEPEANRIAITDWPLLGHDENRELQRVIFGGIRWSVFHMESPNESFKPRNAAQPPRVELIINRIYCPALGISSRSRWRLDLDVRDLGRLIDTRRREEAYGRLMKTIGASDHLDDAQLTLFGGAQT